MARPLAGVIDLDGGKSTPLARQLYEQLRSAIADGRLPQGDRLPSSRMLARQLDISRNTVSAAIDQLAAEGYLDVARGRRPAIAAGFVRLPVVPVAHGQPAAPARPRLSRWARRIGQSDWPFRYEGIPRPFAPGLADAREFPHDLWARCLRRAARNSHPRRRRGHNRLALQEALARHLVEHRGVRTEPRQIIVTPSAQATIELIARVTLDAGDIAWLESPGYGGARVALEAADAEVVGVPLDRSGLVLAKRKERPRLIFVTPSHQYPTGRLMPIDRRLELLRFARITGAALIEDDYDGEFHYDGQPVASLQGLDGTGRVFYVGTFSKAMLADIRVGYTVVPESLVETFEIAQRHTGQLVSETLQDALAEFMDDGAYAAHIRRMTRLYRGRRDRMVQALAAETRDAFVVEPPAGGMQLVARCRLRQDDRRLCTRLAEAGVTARPLSSHYIGKATERGLFLGFAAWTEKEIDIGARVIGRVCGR
jgi:GntR family transcriptional regulator / MocR family aminotransferase